MNMYTKVLLSLSPSQVRYPYRFEMTDKTIYSLEELYYHCYHYWKESLDDFLMGKIEEWIKEELHLPSIANQMAKIKEQGENQITKQYIEFLSLIEYFSDEELYVLSKEIFRWEHKHEWERAKDKGDLYIHKREYQKAIEYYQKALQYTEDVTVLNNVGIAYMEMGQYEKARQYLFAAYGKNSKNAKILLNLSQLAVQEKEYEKAEDYLKKALAVHESGQGWCYYGRLKEKMGQEEEAFEAYQRSITFPDSQDGYIALARWYQSKRDPDKALDILEQMPSKYHWDYYIEKAKILEMQHKEKEGIALLQKAFHTFTPHPQGFVHLSRFYRITHQMDQANKIIQQALQFYPDNKEIQLEWARVQKREGKIKNYQDTLKNILFGWIRNYRSESEDLF
ncbi:MAG: tetratricopeptide repeat protein [Epulopiscium sp.]|nr:tetratricopeptide repeat protein [Candidatus Epulonipiscium sp.]